MAQANNGELLDSYNGGRCTAFRPNPFGHQDTLYSRLQSLSTYKNAIVGVNGDLDAVNGAVDLPIAQSFTAKERPVRPGASISNIDHIAGTACLSVRRRVGVGRGGRYLLSCEHVLFNDVGATTDQDIVQPARSDGSLGGSDVVASHFVKSGLFPHGLNDIDAAIALLEPGVEMNNTPVGESFTLSQFTDNFNVEDDVVMYGRSSGRSGGKIKDVSVHATPLAYEVGPGAYRQLRFRNLVKCNYQSAGGDSGAPVVLLGSRKLVGMHIAGDRNFGYFCRISKIFSRLQISLP